MAFTCDICNASYSLRMSLSNHKRLKHGDTKKFNCQQCEYVTSKKGNYEQHIRSIHEKIREICLYCGKSFSDKPNLNKHVRKSHPEALENKTIVNKRKYENDLENEYKKKQVAATYINCHPGT